MAIAIAIGDLPGASTGQLLALVSLAPVSVAAYAGFYRALELGPIAIVSPIVSAKGRWWCCSRCSSSASR